MAQGKCWKNCVCVCLEWEILSFFFFLFEDIACLCRMQKPELSGAGSKTQLGILMSVIKQRAGSSKWGQERRLGSATASAPSGEGGDPVG